MGTTGVNNVKSSSRGTNANAHHQATTTTKTTTMKPTVLKRGNTAAKKIKFHSVSCEDAAKQESVFHKLDVSNPEQAHKMQQRQKAVEKGKNTVGYDEYCRQVAKEKRRKRSMETPSTPDYTLDVPNKKWNGMVKAWRIALHKYDPQDLQQSFARVAAAQEEQAAPTKGSSDGQPIDVAMTVKEKELAEAQSAGILNLVRVDDFWSPAKSSATIISPRNTDSSMDAAQSPDHGGPIHQSNEMAILDEWEKVRGDGDDAVFYTDAEESDDELL